MAGTAQGIRAGRAFVELSTKDSALRKGLRAAEKRLKDFGATVSRIGASVAGLGAAAASPFLYAINAAGDMAETQSKLDATFKGSADSVRAWADGFAKQVGRSRKQTLDFVTDTGAVLRGMGFGETMAADISQTVAALAVDLGSFFNTSDADALQALISGLVGESEPLKRFGLIVQDAQTRAKLLSQGLDPNSASDMAKVMARLALILEGTTDAQTDATRTAGSFNNQMKALWASLQDITTEIGEALLPAANSFLSTIRSILSPAAAWIKANRGLVVALAAVAGGLVATGVAVVALGLTFTGLGLAIGALTSPLALTVAAFGILAAHVAVAVRNSGHALSWLGDRFMDLTKDAQASVKAIGDALAAGDLALAAKVLWLSLRIEWTKGVGTLKAIWFTLTSAMSKSFADATHGIASAIIDLVAWFQTLRAQDWWLGEGQERIAEIEANRQQAQQALKDMAEVGSREREDTLNADLLALDAELAKVMEEWRKAAADANKARDDVEKARKDKPPAAEFPEPRLPGIGAATAAARRTVDVSGGFQASALAGLGAGSSVAQRQLDEQRGTNSRLDRIDGRIRANRLAFS